MKGLSKGNLPYCLSSVNQYASQTYFSASFMSSKVLSAVGSIDHTSQILLVSLPYGAILFNKCISLSMYH